MERARRLTICLFIVLCTYNIVYSQDIYFVTFVKGDIRKSNDVKIKVGDKLQFQEKVVFSDKDCKLTLLHPSKGRFLIEPEMKDRQSNGEYFLYLKYALHVNNEKIKLSSRGDEDVDEYFIVNPSTNQHMLFIGKSKVALKNSKYIVKDPENDFFFLQYSPPGGKPLNNKLKVLNDTLLIDQSDFIFNGKEAGQNDEVKIGFVQNYSTDKKMTKIGTFKPVLMNLDDCKTLVNTVRSSLGNDMDKVIEECMTQLYYNYGKPDKNVVCAIYNSL